MANAKDDLSDLIPGLTGNPAPLWEGTDDEFSSYMQSTFELPASISTVTITQRAASGRSAVAIGGATGAVVFVLTPNVGKRQTHIRAVLMGPLSDNPTITRRAVASVGEANMSAVTALAMRHLPAGVVLDLLAPVHH